MAKRAKRSARAPASRAAKPASKPATKRADRRIAGKAVAAGAARPHGGRAVRPLPARERAAGPLSAGSYEERLYLLRRRIEDIAQAYVSLASELWIAKDRVFMLEAVLEKHGLPVAAAVDTAAPDGELRKKLDAERRQFAQRAVGALFPTGLPKVD